MNRGQSLCLAGAIALLVGAFLPWATVQSLALGVSRSMAGYQGDSIIAGGVGLILLLVALVAKGTPGKRYSVFAIVLALVAGFVVAVYLPAAADGTKPASGIVVTTGPGLYLSLIGCVLALIGGLQTVPGILAPVEPTTAAPPAVIDQPSPVAPTASAGPAEPGKAPKSPIVTIALAAWVVLVLAVVAFVFLGGS